MYFLHGREGGPGGGKVAALAERTEIVHGRDDEFIPCENAIRFARLRGCTLHRVQGDHRLNARIPLLRALFGAFLSALRGGRAGAFRRADAG